MVIHGILTPMGTSLTRARNTPSDEKAEQIREIAELMSLGQWQLGVTESALATRWHLGISAIRERAAEARRLVAGAFGDLDDLRGNVLAQLSGIAGEQRTKEPRTAVSALMGIAAVAGLIVTGRDPTREPRGNKVLSPAERRAEIARIRAQLDEADALALAEMNAVEVSGESVPDADDGTT